MPIDLVSRLSLFGIGRGHMLARATKIDPNQVNIRGSDANIIVASSSFISYEVVKQLAQKMNALTLDGASNEDLDRWLWDRYLQARLGASASLVTVKFFRPAIGVGGSILPGTKVASLTGIEFITITTATFAPGDLEQTAIARSVLAGVITKVGRNQVRIIREPNLLFDSTIQITNDDPSAGGEDRQSDPDAREQARAFWIAARRGTLPAIEYGAKQVVGVVSAQAVESLGGNGLPARVLTLYVADSSGIANEALGASVSANLEEWRAAGIAVIMSTSTPQIVSIQLRLTFRAGVDTSSLTEQVLAAIIELVNGLKVNETLRRADLLGVLNRFKSAGVIPTNDSIVEPAGDLVPATGKTLRTTSSDVQVV